MAVFWNSADKSASVTLTNGDLTADATTTRGGVRATEGRSSGAHLYAVTIDGPSYSFFIEIGMSTAAHALDGTMDGSSPPTTSFGWYASMNIGDVVKVYIDLAANTAAIDVNDVEVAAFTSVPAGTWYPHVIMNDADQVTANFSATGRSGYTSFNAPVIVDLTESPVLGDTYAEELDLNALGEYTESPSLSGGYAPEISIAASATNSFSLLGTFSEELYWIEDYSEAYDLTDAYSVLATALLTEAISLSGVLSSTMITTTDVSQSITLGELYTVTAIQAVSEGMELDGSFSSTLRLIAAVTEALEGADAYTGSLNVSAAVTVTAALAMALDDQFAANIAEGMTFNDTYAVALKYIAAITAAMQLADTYTNTMTVAMLVTESMELEGAIASNITIAEALHEGLSLSMAFSLGDVDYVAWVINANTGAASRYTNFPFNSFAAVAGRHLACSEDGLYEITGDDDDGTDIDASILTGLMDFGSNVFKRVISCQIGYNGDGELLLKAVVVQGGEPKEYWYQPRSQTATGVRESVAKLGKGLKSHFWQFELINVDGADFEIDSIRWYPVALERRR